MPKRKVAVALSDWLLDELDEAADSRHVSRSALVEEAVADYIVRQRTRAEQRRYRDVAQRALEDMAAFAAECEREAVAAPEPSTLERLRSLRAEGRGVGE